MWPQAHRSAAHEGADLWDHRPRRSLARGRTGARGGAAWVQLRDKTASDDDLAAMVRLPLPEMGALGALLILNDRIEVALDAGADGRHIGQGDGDAVTIRQRMPPGMILGLSIETVAQARLVPPGVDDVAPCT